MHRSEDLYVDELKDLYSAENQLLKALPKMAKAATAPKLSKAFESHLKQTRDHVTRLEKIFKKLGGNPKGKKCKAMEGLLAEGKELMAEDADAAVMDAALIGAAQRVEHYEMAGYGCVRTYARLLGHDDAADLLQKTLDEEGAADKATHRIGGNNYQHRGQQRQRSQLKYQTANGTVAPRSSSMSITIGGFDYVRSIDQGSSPE